MSSTPNPIWDRLDDLLVEQATAGLSPADAAELVRLLAAAPDRSADGVELAAAAADLAMTDPSTWTPMPVSLRAKVIAQAAEWTGARAVRAGASVQTRSPARGDVAGRIVPAKRDLRSHLGWLVAAAAIIVAVIGWLPKPGTTPTPGPNHQTASLAPRAALQKLLAEAKDVVRVSWTPTEDPAAGPKEAKEDGEVIWSSAKQEGYMVFHCLASNDPKVEQYQLWIFDVNQHPDYPMHGGVFDIPPGQTEVIVRITAMLPVTKPTMFAVTREKPGGVWVSDRKRLPVLAKVSS